MAGTIPTGIDEIVSRLDNVRWQNVLFEAITNSLQANATEINVKFFTNAQEQLKELRVLPKVKQAIIEDNGVGFTEENINSFKKHMSSYKKSLGCKGIGRFFYLKKFEKVYITSLDYEIDFRIDNDIDNSFIKVNSVYKKTSVRLDNPREEIIVDVDNLKAMIKEHFLADFKLRRNDIVINVYIDALFQFAVKSNENPNFEQCQFNIGIHTFTLFYLCNKDEFIHSDGYYCAGLRVVIKNSQLHKDKKFGAIKEFPMVYILMSDYFDEKVNDSRDDFDIYPKLANRTILNELAWDDINLELTKQIRIIAKNKGVDLANIAQINLEQAINKSPYLIHYLQDNKDMLDFSTLLENAKRRLEQDKIKLRNSVLNNDNFQKTLYSVTQTELAEYIFDRQKIIDKLKALTEESVLEDNIHNLFMKKNTQDEMQDYKSNNLWLFDDRFMSYDKVFSNAKIQKIFPELHNNLKQPDILSIISNTYNENEITDIVIIELKRPSDNIDPSGAESQLLKYARYINDLRDNKIRIWTYAFMYFNQDVVDVLDKDRGYNQIPVKNGYQIFYKYHPTQNIIINFIDYFALAQDADNRNHTFMKILRGDSYKVEEANIL